MAVWLSCSASAYGSTATFTVTVHWDTKSYNGYSPSGTLYVNGTGYPFNHSFNTSQTTSGSEVLFTKTLTLSGSSATYSASFNSGTNSGTLYAPSGGGSYTVSLSGGGSSGGGSSGGGSSSGGNVSTYTLYISPASGTTIYVYRGDSVQTGTRIYSGATLYNGEFLYVYCIGGTLIRNGAYLADAGEGVLMCVAGNMTFTSSTGGNSGGGSTSVSSYNLKLYHESQKMSLTVRRTSSPSAGASTNVVLSHGDIVYVNDLLQFTFSANAGCKSAWVNVNGKDYYSTFTWQVNGTVEIYGGADVISYTLITNASSGSAITVNRTSSPLQGAAIEEITNGDTIYYNDELFISFSADTGYELFDCTINNSSSSDGSYTVNNELSIVSNATVKSYSLSIWPDDHSSIAVIRTSSPLQGAPINAVLQNGEAIYYNDILQITYAPSSAEYKISSCDLASGSTNYAVNNGDTHTVTDSVIILIASELSGIILIHDGNSFEQYLTYIHNGIEFEQYIPYVYDGSDWVICTPPSRTINSNLSYKWHTD